MAVVRVAGVSDAEAPSPVSLQRLKLRTVRRVVNAVKE
jgi:hypothetical protein